MWVRGGLVVRGSSGGVLRGAVASASVSTVALAAACSSVVPASQSPVTGRLSPSSQPDHVRQHRRRDLQHSRVALRAFSTDSSGANTNSDADADAETKEGKHEQQQQQEGAEAVFQPLSAVETPATAAWTKAKLSVPAIPPLDIASASRLNKELAGALKAAGHTSLLPTQAAAFNAVTDPQQNYKHYGEEGMKSVLLGSTTLGRHVTVIRTAGAQSGRKLAIAVAVLQHLIDTKATDSKLQAVVLTPTHDVADLVGDTLRQLISDAKLSFKAAILRSDASYQAAQDLPTQVGDSNHPFPTVFIGTLDRWSLVAASAPNDKLANVKLIAVYDADALHYTVNRMNFYVSQRRLPQQVDHIFFSKSGGNEVLKPIEVLLGRSLPPVVNTVPARDELAANVEPSNVFAKTVPTARLMVTVFEEVHAHIKANPKQHRVVVYVQTPEMAEFLAHVFSNMSGYSRFSIKSKSKVESDKKQDPTWVFDLASVRENALISTGDTLSNLMKQPTAIAFSTVDPHVNQAFAKDVTLALCVNAPTDPQAFEVAIRGVKDIHHQARDKVAALMLLSPFEQQIIDSLASSWRSEMVRLLPVPETPSSSSSSSSSTSSRSLPSDTAISHFNHAINSVRDPVVKRAWISWVGWANVTYRKQRASAGAASRVENTIASNANDLAASVGFYAPPSIPANVVEMLALKPNLYTVQESIF